MTSPSNGATLAPGRRVVLKLRVRVDPNDNLGLALALVDLVQDPGNPQQVSLPPGRPLVVMSGFDWPNGFANPRKSFSASGFGGTQIRNELGGFDLVQIGGGQNTFGVPGPCLGPDQDICIGQDVVVDPGVGQTSFGQVLATVQFNAPSTPGTYTFHIENAIANTLAVVNAPPMPSVVNNAQTQITPSSSVTFVVQ